MKLYARTAVAGVVLLLTSTAAFLLLRAGPLASGDAGALERAESLSLLVDAGLIAAVTAAWAIPLRIRLARLEDCSRAVARRDFSSRVGDTRRDELGRVARAFDEMAGELETLLADRRHVLAAVSHDFKTPLARLRFGLRELTAPLTPQQRQALAEALDGDLEELDQLVERLLLLARENAPPREPPRAVQLDALVERRLERLADPRARLRVEAEPPGPHFVVHAGPRGTASLVDNLLLNATHHAARRVELRLRREALERGVPGFVLEVSDDGPGVAEAERERIFEAGVSEHGAGRGLGLAIVAELARTHGWRVGVETSAHGGARFWVRGRLLDSSDSSPPEGQCSG